MKERALNVGVIGCGRWGSCIAWYLDSIGHNVTMYGREGSKRMATLMAERKNEYLEIPESMNLTTNMDEALNGEVVIISVNAQNLDSLAKQIAEKEIKDKTFVLCMKGLEIEGHRTLTQIMRDNIDGSNDVAVWIGPGHVEEFYKGVPNCMVIDSDRERTKDFLVKAFTGNLIRFYYGSDLIGNEIGAAAKNVIGIAAGMLDGSGLTSLKGALMSRGTREVARLILAMGGNELSAYGLCHLGDYEATVFSSHSHNRKFGECFVKGEEYTSLAEGYYTAKAIVELAKEKGVDMPICNVVYTILYENRDAREAIDSLFERSLKEELY